tara:strand:- start:73 stop:492 length:420 start_codon:yes stop_codon:yes gene_type:complete
MEFSRHTIQKMFNEYIANEYEHIADVGCDYVFHYTVSKSQNLFVHGMAVFGGYELILTSKDYLIDPDILDGNGVELLKKLGWRIKEAAGMYVLVVTSEQLQNGDASSVVYHSLKAYNLLDHEIDFSEYEINKIGTTFLR